MTVGAGTVVVGALDSEIGETALVMDTSFGRCG